MPYILYMVHKWGTGCGIFFASLGKYSDSLHITFLLFLCLWTWIWMVLSCDLNESYQTSTAKKVADLLPLRNISPAAPCLVVLVVNAWQWKRHMNSQIMLFSHSFLIHHHSCLLCSAHLESSYWSKTFLPSCNECPVWGGPRERNLDIPVFGISAVLMNPQLTFLSCRTDELRRPTKSEPVPRINVRVVFMIRFERHIISTLA